MLADAACMTCSLLLLAALPPILGYAGLLTAMVGIALPSGGSIPLFSAFIARNFGPAHLESNIGMTATVSSSQVLQAPMQAAVFMTQSAVIHRPYLWPAQSVSPAFWRPCIFLTDTRAFRS